MHAAEIVIAKLKSDSGFRLGNFFTETVGQPRKSPHPHSYGQVLPFHKDVLMVLEGNGKACRILAAGSVKLLRLLLRRLELRPARSLKSGDPLT
jgi:hypothetical protein